MTYIEQVLADATPSPENKIFWTGIAPDIHCVDIEKYILPDGVVVEEGKHYLTPTAPPHKVDSQWGEGMAQAMPFVEVVQTGNVLSVVRRNYDNVRINDSQANTPSKGDVIFAMNYAAANPDNKEADDNFTRLRDEYDEA